MKCLTFKSIFDILLFILKGSFFLVKFWKNSSWFSAADILSLWVWLKRVLQLLAILSNFLNVGDDLFEFCWQVLDNL